MCDGNFFISDECDTIVQISSVVDNSFVADAFHSGSHEWVLGCFGGLNTGESMIFIWPNCPKSHIEMEIIWHRGRGRPLCSPKSAHAVAIYSDKFTQIKVVRVRSQAK